jgi:hypothetical protein
VIGGDLDSLLGPSSDDEGQDEDRRLGEESPYQHDEPMAENMSNEDIPDQPQNPAGPSLDARPTISDGLSDSDGSGDLSDDTDIVEITDLQRFASVLQEAQRRAVQLEKEKSEQKRKTLKTYLCNSRTTRYCREKARKELVSQGFPDIRSFMVLKGAEKVGVRLEGEGRANRVRDASAGAGTDAAAENAIASHPSPDRIPSPLDQPQSNLKGRRTFAEEEEGSSDEGDIPSHDCLDDSDRARSWFTGDDARVAGGLRNPSGKGKERGWVAEEEEESSCESAELVSVARYREAKAGTGEDDETGPHPVRSARSWNAGTEDDGNGDNIESEGADLDAPAPSPSRTPSVFSGRSSPCSSPGFEESEGRGGTSALETSEKCLELWNDREALSRARAALVDKSRDSRLGIVLRARITGMLGFLNLYLDPSLQYTWRKASAMVAKVQGRGEKRTQKLREWTLTFARSANLPELHYSQARWNVLDDEDISQTLQSMLLSHIKGRYITANDVVEIVAGTEMQAKFSHSGISRTSISERTARRWLQRLSWHYGTMRNGMYLDGHEREDVVAYRTGFVERWKGYESRFHTWDNDGTEHRPQKAFPVKGGRFRLILVTHDESIFYQNDFRKTHWIADTSKATPLPKGDGQSIMVSDFLTAEWGRLLDEGPDGAIESVFNSLNAHFIITIFLLQRS